MDVIYSMTGYGKGEAQFKDISILVELRSVNSRFFEMGLHLPETLSILDERIRANVHKRIRRGRVNVYLVYKRPTNTGKGEFVLDTKLARQYYDLLINLKKELGLNAGPELFHITALPNLILYKEKEPCADEAWPFIEKALNIATDGLLKMREQEGKAICRDLSSHIHIIEASLCNIKRRYPATLNKCRMRLKKRVKEWHIKPLKTISDGHLEQEIVLMIENSDISEELSRMDSHLNMFRNTLAKGGEAGKKLDFIIQEMHREVNTIGAKSHDFSISKKVVDMKVAIEKMREQVQNIE